MPPFSHWRDYMPACAPNVATTVNCIPLDEPMTIPEILQQIIDVRQAAYERVLAAYGGGTCNRDVEIELINLLLAKLELARYLEMKEKYVG